MKNIMELLVFKVENTLLNSSGTSVILCYHSLSNSYDKYAVNPKKFKEDIMNMKKHFENFIHRSTKLWRVRSTSTNLPRSVTRQHNFLVQSAAAIWW